MEIVPATGNRCPGAAEETDILKKERDDAIRFAKDMREQVEAMDVAARLLLRAVSMPSTDPPSPNRLCTDEIRQDEARAEYMVNEEDQIFDEMQKSWKLEQTCFPSLFSACKMMRDSRHLMAQEADHALDEMRMARETTLVLEKRIRQAERALCKLYKENKELSRKNENLEVRLNEINVEKNKQLDEFYSVCAHEEALSSRSNSFDTQESRSQSPPIPSPPATPKRLTLSPPLWSPASKVLGEAGIGSIMSPRTDHDENTNPDFSSPSRPNKGGATVHFEDETLLIGDLIGRWMNKNDQHRGVYQITFPSRREIGIKLHSMPINPAQRGGSKSPTQSPTPRRTLVDVNRLLRRHPDAFIVWGFRDVDTCCSSRRPTIGARLVAVDGVSVENGRWGTLSELCRSIRSEGGPVKLSFRNDAVTKEQIEHLNRVLTPKSRRSPGGERPTTVCLLKTPQRRHPVGMLPTTA